MPSVLGRKTPKSVQRYIFFHNRGKFFHLYYIFFAIYSSFDNLSSSHYSCHPYNVLTRARMTREREPLLSTRFSFCVTNWQFVTQKLLWTPIKPAGIN